MKRIKTLLLVLILSMCAMAQSERFSITLNVDSAIASEPQKVYLYSMIEKQMQLHDSLSIDSVHRIGTMHGKVTALPFTSATRTMVSDCAIQEGQKDRKL